MPFKNCNRIIKLPMYVLVVILVVLNPAVAYSERRIERQIDDGTDVAGKVHGEIARDCQPKAPFNIAQKAAAEAKAAHAAQDAAGAQAAHMVKSQLAEKALQAAKAADAALAGKQALVEQLQQQVVEAEAVVAQNARAIQKQELAVNAANQAHDQATAQYKLLSQAVQLASQVEKSTMCVLDKTKAALEEKVHHLSDARSRLGQLQHKLQCAREDCAATKQAALAAAEAARAACGNARKKKHVRRHLVSREKHGR
ncbi:uncharacterized protein LOC121736128 [Aricia agestis]|uniref:uncharacterized protein LOC121736128 n=1 Tax=Aricia agestis TaxID=91739 RepID=UPI001C204F2A|nr:uncharacterized protein LOC121736128 [Aricia agestis]